MRIICLFGVLVISCLVGKILSASFLRRCLCGPDESVLREQRQLDELAQRPSPSTNQKNHPVDMMKQNQVALRGIQGHQQSSSNVVDHPPNQVALRGIQGHQQSSSNVVDHPPNQVAFRENQGHQQSYNVRQNHDLSVAQHVGAQQQHGIIQRNQDEVVMFKIEELDDEGVPLNFHHILLAVTVIVKQYHVFDTINMQEAKYTIIEAEDVIVANKIFQTKQCDDSVEAGRVMILLTKSNDIPYHLMALIENAASYPNTRKHINAIVDWMISTKTEEDELKTRMFGGLLLLAKYTKTQANHNYDYFMAYICFGKPSYYKEIVLQLVDRIDSRESPLVKYLHNYGDLLDLIFRVVK